MNSIETAPVTSIPRRIFNKFWAFTEYGDIFGKALFLWSTLLIANVSIYFALSKSVIPSGDIGGNIVTIFLEIFLGYIKFYILAGILGYMAILILKITQNGIGDEIIYAAIFFGCFNVGHISLFFGRTFLTLTPFFYIIGITNVTIFMGYKKGSFMLLCSILLYVVAFIFFESRYFKDFPISLSTIAFDQVFAKPLVMFIFGILLTLALLYFGSLTIRDFKLLKEKTEETMRMNVELKASNIKLKELDFMKTNFLSKISHDLRTPLTSIKGYSHILRNNIGQFDEKEQKEYLEIVEEESDHLVGMVSDLLDLQALEAGKMSFNFQDANIVSLIEESVESLKATAHKKNLSFDKKLPDKEIIVKADRGLLSRAVGNLLINAINFSPEKGRIKIVVEPTEQNNKPGVMVSVADNGPTVSKEYQAALFDKFQQTKISGEPLEKRGGIGMAIVGKIIEHHGGAVGVRSEHGEENIFYFLLYV